MADQSPMISMLDAAERLGVDVMEIYGMIDSGHLTVAWNDGRLVVLLTQVEALAGAPR